MRVVILALIGLASHWLSVDALANPLPLSKVTPLDNAIAEVIATQGTTGGSELTRLMSRYGFSFSKESLDAVRANMPLFEQFILASQRDVERLDGRLHAAFGQWASQAARDSMCAILRARLSSRDREYRQRRPEALTLTEVRDLVVCGEILADYGDTKAIAPIAAIRKTLQEIDHANISRFHASETPEWFLGMALRRIENPDATAILVPRIGNSGLFRVSRKAADIATLLVTVDSGPDAHWHEVAPDPTRDQRILLHLAISRSAPHLGYGWYPDHRWACMRIVFGDGAEATIDLTTAGVRYTDNTRYSVTGRWIVSDELVKDVWELADQFEDMVDVW